MVGGPYGPYGRRPHTVHTVYHTVKSLISPFSPYGGLTARRPGPGGQSQSFFMSSSRIKGGSGTSGADPSPSTTNALQSSANDV